MMRANAGRNDVQSMLVWSDALADAKGHEARADALMAIVKSYPDAGAARVALAYAMAGPEDDVREGEDSARLTELLQKEREDGRSPVTSGMPTTHAGSTSGSGSDEALAAAEKAVGMNAASANAQIAMAEVLAARGDTEKASEWTQRAAKGGHHIGYARLIALQTKSSLPSVTVTTTAVSAVRSAERCVRRLYLVGIGAVVRDHMQDGTPTHFQGQRWMHSRGHHPACR